MVGECAVCLNSLMEAAPEPPSAGVAVGAPRKKRTKMFLEESKDTRDVCVTPCGHVFHAQCLKQWYPNESGAKKSQKVACPICRTLVARGSPKQVFLGGGESSGVHTPGSSASAATSEPSSSGASMASVPAPGGSGTQPVPDMGILEGAAPVAYQGNDFNELRDLHNLLIQDYAAIQQRVEALEEERDILKVQFLSLQPEVVLVDCNAPARGGGSRRQTAIRGRR